MEVERCSIAGDANEHLYRWLYAHVLFVFMQWWERVAPFMVIKNHLFSGQWKANEELYYILPYNKFGFISKGCKGMGLKAWKSPFFTTHCLLLPLHGTHANMIILPETSPCSTFLALIVCVYHHSHFRGGLRKHIVRQSAQWQLKVIQGHWFEHQSKARMQLPISDQ